MREDQLVLIKGAGDLATGVAWRLHRSGFPVVMTELAYPLAVRRTVSFAQAIFDGEWDVEEVTARRVAIHDVPDTIHHGDIPVLIDPTAEAIDVLGPTVVIDAIIAKTNLGTHIAQAQLVIGLGPGFTAGDDCHAVVETHRGHTLGRVIWGGTAMADTGIPGALPEVGSEASRVLRSPGEGYLLPEKAIGDRVDAGELIARLQRDDDTALPLTAAFDGILRGLVHPTVRVTSGMKVGDVDPRLAPENAHTISDKSLSVAGGVLEAILTWQQDTFSDRFPDEYSF